MEYELTPGTILHGGYARYFKVPPFDQVALGTVQKFADTTDAAPVNSGSDRIGAETDDYFDAGIRQRILEASECRPRWVFQAGAQSARPRAVRPASVVTAPLTYRQQPRVGLGFQPGVSSARR